MEPEASIAEALGSHRLSLVLPSCGEGDAPLGVLETLGPETLAVVVVNEPTLANTKTREANRQTLAALATRYPGGVEHASAWVTRVSWGQLVVIDRTEDNALPPKQGVGLARKIGADIAFASWRLDPRRAPAIAFTDADVTLPPSYCDSVASVDWRTTAAAWHVFRHEQVAEAVPDLIWAYEIWLRYLVLGLHHAGSQYAFHTVGSTQVVSTDHYARVRGVPKRLAGEDFYLFNKLAKVGPIRQIGTQPIVLSGRVSDRVPFGTGAAMSRWSHDAPVESFLVFDPRVFDCIRQLVLEIHDWTDANDDLAGRLRANASLRNVPTALAGMNVVDRCYDAKARTTDSATLRRRIADMFDGFWTLKLMHRLRDHYYANLVLRDALCRAAFVPISNVRDRSLHELATQIRTIDELRGKQRGQAIGKTPS